MKFKYNYLANHLAYQKPLEETWQQISPEQQFTGNFESCGFNLEEGWITFSVYHSKIRAFYKQINSPADLTDFWEPQQVTYFRKDLPKQAELIFEFSLPDEIEKVAGKWIKKGGSHD